MVRLSSIMRRIWRRTHVLAGVYCIAQQGDAQRPIERPPNALWTFTRARRSWGDLRLRGLVARCRLAVSKTSGWMVGSVDKINEWFADQTSTPAGSLLLFLLVFLARVGLDVYSRKRESKRTKARHKEAKNSA